MAFHYLYPYGSEAPIYDPEAAYERLVRRTAIHLARLCGRAVKDCEEPPYFFNHPKQDATIAILPPPYVLKQSAPHRSTRRAYLWLGGRFSDQSIKHLALIVPHDKTHFPVRSASIQLHNPAADIEIITPSFQAYTPGRAIAEQTLDTLNTVRRRDRLLELPEDFDSLWLSCMPNDHPT